MVLTLLYASDRRDTGKLLNGSCFRRRFEPYA